MLVFMKTFLFGLCLIISVPVHAGIYHLTHQQWAVPRKADSVLTMPALRGALDEMRKTAGSRLILRYPGGDAGTLWVKELQSWLVSLGLPSSQMEIIPGSRKTNVIEIEVIPPSGLSEKSDKVYLFLIVDKEMA